MSSHAADASALAADAEKMIQSERFSEAAPLLEQAVRLSPGDPEIRYRLGYTQFRLRRLEAARSNLVQVVRSAPPAHYSRYFLGRIALLENKPAEAVTWLEPVRVLDWASQLAAAYAMSGQTAKAMGLLRTAIAAEPWDGSLYYRLGRLQQKMGQPALAKESLAVSARLKETSRTDVEVLMAVSRSLTELRREEGRDIGRQISERKDADPDALVALGVLYGGASMDQDAMQAFAAAVARKQDYFQAQFNLGLALLRSNRTREALGPLAEAVKLLPQSEEAGITYGLACVMGQKYAEAVPPLERAWKSGKAPTRAGALLGTALLRSGNSVRAAAVLRDAASRPDADLPAHMLLVEAMNEAHDMVGALSAALAAEKKFANEPQAYMASGQQLARAGRYPDARGRFEKVRELQPENAEASLGLADCLQKTGRYQEALEPYRAALNGATTWLASRLGLARSLLALRQFDECRMVLLEARERYPDDATVKLELARVDARLAAVSK